MPWRVIGQETIDVKNYFCDACGCEFQDLSRAIDTGKEGSLRVVAEFGYPSNRDGERYDYFFCQDCATNILSYIDLQKKLKDTTIDI